MRFLSLLSLLLALALTAGCVTPSQDPVPEPGADDPSVLVVPPMSQAPLLDGTPHADEWAEALTISGNFTIADGLRASGTYPFNFSIGADATTVYATMSVDNAGMNPWTNTTTPGKRSWWPDAFALFLTPRLNGSLVAPSDMKFFRNTHDPEEGLMTVGTDDSFWDGHYWQMQPDIADAVTGYAHNRTVTWEIAFPRHSPLRNFDGVEFGPGQTFRAALMFGRQGSDPSPVLDGPIRFSRDVFPAEGYTPLANHDPSGWLKFRMYKP